MPKPHPKRSLPNPSRRFENEAAALGFQNIAGIDEVGRGCLAGPVVACCVILPRGEKFPGVQDSKLLNAKQREIAFELIKSKALGIGIGSVDAPEIDQINILRATFKAMRIALENINNKPDFLLVDGSFSIRDCSIPQKAIIQGDRLSLSIAAASIVAKVTRDRWMADFMEQFPQFRFDLHKGYGTQRHREELKTHGPTPLHRFSFGLL